MVVVLQVKEEMKKEKRRIQEQLRRIKRNQDRENAGKEEDSGTAPKDPRGTRTEKIQVKRRIQEQLRRIKRNQDIKNSGWHFFMFVSFALKELKCLEWKKVL